MNKLETLAVLHEIVNVLSSSIPISGISLDPLNSKASKDADNDGFLIRIKCDMDNYSKECLKLLLEKHELAMEESKGYILIFPC